MPIGNGQKRLFLRTSCSIVKAQRHSKIQNVFYSVFFMRRILFEILSFEDQSTMIPVAGLFLLSPPHLGNPQLTCVSRRQYPHE